MPTSEPLHIAFVWHMHQPDYRSAQTGVFEMPWARMHALKDYLDMVETLSDYPQLHQTFNLVPVLVEQLEEYASGDFVDVYWEHTLKPAEDLEPLERAFVVERMCERSDHPRAHLHPRYLELAQKREAGPSQSWEECADAFSVDDLRDLQVWFNLAWFDPQLLACDPLSELVAQGRNFSEKDKEVIAQVQADILTRTLSAYRDAAGRGQIELSTSPYYHPILPLLINSDCARIAAPDTLLPSRRFSHPEDAAEQISRAMDKHERVFGKPPRGMWCSEQAVGEDVIPLLVEAGLAWTISDETVLARSLQGATGRVPALRRSGPKTDPRSPLGHATASRHDRSDPSRSGGRDHVFPYVPYRLQRETGELSIVFRDHTLSDLIGFTYQSWDSSEAAADLLRRLRELQKTFASSGPTDASKAAHQDAAGGPGTALVTIALDGENAWEFYPRDGHDFLRYLYEGLSSDPSFRCVTVSEHLKESPPARTLDWLHTGSWIGGDLRTWSGDRAHNTAWDLLHQARDLAVERLGSLLPDRPISAPREAPRGDGGVATGVDAGELEQSAASFNLAATAWQHILTAEGSDWFWWFGDHHHTDLDYAWDHAFRLHLREVYRCLNEPVPPTLLIPVLGDTAWATATLPQDRIAPLIDGSLGNPDEWAAAGVLAPSLPSAMQRSHVTELLQVCFGWNANRLLLLVIPGQDTTLEGLEMDIRVARPGAEDDPPVHLTLEEQGRVEVSCIRCTYLRGPIEAAWKDVLEVSIPMDASALAAADPIGLVVEMGRGGAAEHVYHSVGLASLGWKEQ